MSKLPSTPLLTDAPIGCPLIVGTDGDGAEVRFLGRVRAMEGERRILGIEYAAYAPMAERALNALRREAELDFGAHDCVIVHRTGFVPCGEASILVAVASPHSGRAFELCRHYLDRIKSSVPIWKHPVFA